VRESLNQMHSFDPRDAIFLLNKWETLSRKQSKVELFEELKRKVHGIWKDVEDRQILKFAATEESNLFLSPWKIKCKPNDFRYHIYKDVLHL
jgi:hypothetical protein